MIAHVRGNVVGYVALVFALSGSAYAASSLPANSVGTKQLKDHAVTTRKLSQHSVGPSIVKNNSLTGKQIKSGTLGTVPNSSALGGTGASVFQNLLTANCTSSGGAISKVNGDGSVGCSSAGRAEVFGGTIAGSDLNGATSNFVAPSGLSAPDTTESNVTASAPGIAGTASNLSVTVQTPPGLTHGWVVLMRVGTPSQSPSATTLTCKIENTATSCSDNTDTASIPAGAPVDIEFTPEGTPASTRALFGWTAGS